jgi:CHRD domain
LFLNLQNFIMKRLFNFLAIATLLTVGSSCGKDDTPPPVADPTITFAATLSGAAEVPANASTATGTATLKFDTTTKIFTLKVTHTIATPTNGHIHKAAAGVSGGVVFPFVAPFASPIDYTSVALTAAQEADLRANLYYVNIHTAAFGGGEIRGQLLKQ